MKRRTVIARIAAASVVYAGLPLLGDLMLVPPAPSLPRKGRPGGRSLVAPRRRTVAAGGRVSLHERGKPGAVHERAQQRRQKRRWARRTGRGPDLAQKRRRGRQEGAAGPAQESRLRLRARAHPGHRGGPRHAVRSGHRGPEAARAGHVGGAVGSHCARLGRVHEGQRRRCRGRRPRRPGQTGNPAPRTQTRRSPLGRRR
jgi:hypothetical protein